MKLENDVQAAIEAYQFSKLDGRSPIWIVVKVPNYPKPYVARMVNSRGPSRTTVARDSVKALRRDLLSKLRLSAGASTYPNAIEEWS